MNFSDGFKQVIAAVAPAIGTALGGPFGGLAGTFLASKLGTSPGDQKALEAAVATASPDIMLKLKQADNDFKAHLSDIGLSEDKLVFDDKANARTREMAVKDLTPSILAYLVTAGFFGVLFMMYKGKPAEGGDALLVMLGSLGTAWAGVIAYYFGSSLGSARKDATIGTMASKQ